jgi:protein TonB
MFAPDQRPLRIAIVVSLLVHAVLLSLHFAAPDAIRMKPLSTGLDVILVNAREQAAPLDADALAQANLDGGGHADAGRARSPLPNLGQVNDGTQLEMQRRRVAELEARQRRLLAQLSKDNAQAMPAGEQVERPDINGRDVRSVEEIQQMARREAEIARDVADYNRRPIKTQLTPSTREVAYALYYTALQKKIEQTGTLHFPQRDGKKIYGELIVYIPVAQDGSLYEKEGGPRIERSSGDAVLDAAAIAIVRRAAPFGSFPAQLQRDGRERVWEIITRFAFTREQGLETSVIRRGE